jgi:hypothetical protein
VPSGDEAVYFMTEDRIVEGLRTEEGPNAYSGRLGVMPRFAAMGVDQDVGVDGDHRDAGAP